MAGTPVREAIDSAMVALTAAGVDTPRLDAEVLLAHVLGTERLRLLSDRDVVVEGPSVRAFQDAVRRRAVDREPVAYITGVKGFRYLDLYVDPRVLVPRPETELVVDCCLALLDGAVGPDVLDIGTGDRAEKIRTYNYGERRVTDHRVKLTEHNLEQVLEGELEPFTEALTDDERRRRLESQAAAT